MLARASLPTFLILGVLSLTSAAQAFDRTCAQRQDAQGQSADRCMASMTVPETVVYGTLSDHGGRLASATTRRAIRSTARATSLPSPTGRSGSIREVFVQEPAFRR